MDFYGPLYIGHNEIDLLTRPFFLYFCVSAVFTVCPVTSVFDVSYSPLPGSP